MKRLSLLYIAAIALLVASCSGNKQSFTLFGDFKGLETGEFLCFSQSPAWNSLDTVKVMGGAFTYTCDLTDTAIIVLQYPNFMQTQIVAIPGSSVRLSGDANNMKRISLSGDDENEALSDFNSQTADKTPAQAAKEAEKFIRANPHMWASIALLDRFFLKAEHPDLDKISKLLTPMLKARPKRSVLHMIEGEVAPLLKCRVGSKLPAFKAVTIGGKPVSNADFSGKAVLVTFWSTVDNSLMAPLVNQHRLLRRLADRVSQLNICLDADTASCVRVLRADTIGGYNVCDRKSFGSPLVKTFGLGRLPANILVDQRGVVRARDIAPDNLLAELRKIGIQ